MVFDWDEGNLGHIAQHHITPEEAEHVIANRPFDIKVQLRRNEERYLQVGETSEGRILVVVTTWRGSKVRVVTAFAANQRMRRFYEEHKAQGTNEPDEGAQVSE
jgi:uncharacterized protein